jgi:CheY-like chemotaxis protein
MGGEIGVESTVGEGSRFWVEFTEMAPEQAKPAAGKSNAEELSDVNERLAALSAKKVLYIEDNEMNRLLMTNILSIFPELEVKCAQDGGEGLRMLNAFSPDLLLLDLHLPDMNGKDILRKIKIQGSRVPVIVVSADAMPETAKEVMLLGATNYMAKPIDSAVLKAMMVKALAG